MKIWAHIIVGLCAITAFECMYTGPDIYYALSDFQTEGHRPATTGGFYHGSGWEVF